LILLNVPDWSDQISFLILKKKTHIVDGQASQCDLDFWRDDLSPTPTDIDALIFALDIIQVEWGRYSPSCRVCRHSWTFALVCCYWRHLCWFVERVAKGMVAEEKNDWKVEVIDDEDEQTGYTSTSLFLFSTTPLLSYRSYSRSGH